MVMGDNSHGGGYRSRWFQTSRTVAHGVFFADDGILDSLQPARLQAALCVLMGLFDRVSLQKK